MYQVNETIKRILGQRLKNCRESKGMTQEDLGRKIGYTSMAIARYENGLCNFNIGMLLLFCQVLDVSPSIFVQGMETYHCSVHPGEK